MIRTRVPQKQHRTPTADKITRTAGICSRRQGPETRARASDLYSREAPLQTSPTFPFSNPNTRTHTQTYSTQKRRKGQTSTHSTAQTKAQRQCCVALKRRPGLLAGKEKTNLESNFLLIIQTGKGWKRSKFNKSRIPRFPAVCLRDLPYVLPPPGLPQHCSQPKRLFRISCLPHFSVPEILLTPSFQTHFLCRFFSRAVAASYVLTDPDR